jgi:flagellin-like hook-associated protein FlgL
VSIISAIGGNSKTAIKNAVLILIVIVSTVSAGAQDTTLLKKERAEIQAEISAIYAKIEKVFKATNFKLFNQMQGELKVINSMTNTLERNNALASYKSKYKGTYQQVIKLSGISMSDAAVSLTQRYIHYGFFSDDLIAMIWQFIKRKPVIVKTPTGTQITSQPISDLKGTENINCSNIAGASVLFGPKSVKASSTATDGATCDVQGIISKTILLPAKANNFIVLNTGFTTTDSLSAVGVSGTAFASTELWMTPYTITDRNISTLVGTNDVAAPILWAVSKTLSVGHSESLDLTPLAGQNLLIMAKVRSNTLSTGCCGTKASCKIGFTKLDLIEIK